MLAGLGITAHIDAAHLVAVTLFHVVTDINQACTISQHTGFVDIGAHVGIGIPLGAIVAANHRHVVRYLLQ